MLHTPRGVRDLLPPGARQKQELESRLTRQMALWGYEPVVTPTFEFADVLRKAQSTQSDEELYRFVDREGQVLALRPEMTVPIARVVASRLKEAPTPLRLQYVGSVFRYDEPQSGRLREFTQAGLELIGAPGPAADAEVIAIMISTLTELGLANFRMDMGHVGFTASVIRGLGLSEKASAALRGALLRQDYVGMERVLDESGAGAKAREDLHTLISLRGGSEVFDAAERLTASEEAERALQNVADVFDHLESQGVAGWVTIDLSMLRQAPYYTGVVIEGYTADMGYTLCSGGRYDTLLGRFGYDVPATGVALGVERLLLALDRFGAQNGEASRRLLFVATKERRAEACSVAWRLRRQGIIVENDVMDLTLDEAESDAMRRGIPVVVVFEGPVGARVTVIESGGRRTIHPDDLLEGGLEG